MPNNEAEKKLKKELKARGGVVSVKTVHPNPNNRSEYARIYVVRTRGKRGGKTVMGPIQRKGK